MALLSLKHRLSSAFLGDAQLEADQALDRLTRHQQRIHAVLAIVKGALRDDAPNGAKAVALARWEMLRVLREYQLFKHVEIFNPLIAQGDLHRAQAASRLKSRCIAMAGSYGEHVERWSRQTPASAWPEYVGEAKVMADRIAGHLDKEAAGVADLLIGVRRTRIG